MLGVPPSFCIFILILFDNHMCRYGMMMKMTFARVERPPRIPEDAVGSWLRKKIFLVSGHGTDCMFQGGGEGEIRRIGLRREEKRRSWRGKQGGKRSIWREGGTGGIQDSGVRHLSGESRV